MPLTEGGIVIDIGTGDGRFVSAMARQHPDKFFIGVDANVKPLEKPSMRATRKPAKGGLKNALFVQAAVEDLPAEFDGVADEIHIHFPWGSLLGAVATGDAQVLSSLRRIASDDCALEIIFGGDRKKDRSELERLKIPEITLIYLHSYLIPKYVDAGFHYMRTGRLSRDEARKIDTSWSRRLSQNDEREFFFLEFET
ncbi:MAG TPA: methyltransferase domain-containing protein [Pyrinomonadaceae bacterium]|nr:methyltransferase domain-containing protein [Pyrinomonadaceae bacterium]